MENKYKHIGFGRENEPVSQSEFNKHIDKYVILQTPYNLSEVGKYVGTIKNDERTFAVLNPHLSVRIDPLKGHITTINNKDYEIEINSVIGIKPTTLDNLENSVKNSEMQANTNYLEFCLKTNSLKEQLKKQKGSKE